jgi:hypothetical protein
MTSKKSDTITLSCDCGTEFTGTVDDARAQDWGVYDTEVQCPNCWEEAQHFLKEEDPYVSTAFFQSI